jgi:hypothetical protein
MHIRKLFRLNVSRGLLAALTLWCLVAPGLARAEGELVPPYQSWKLSETACDNVQHPFQSPWSGDDPMAIMQQYVDLLNVNCSGSAGALFVVRRRSHSAALITADRLSARSG